MNKAADVKSLVSIDLCRIKAGKMLEDAKFHLSEQNVPS